MEHENLYIVLHKSIDEDGEQYIFDDVSEAVELFNYYRRVFNDEPTMIYRLEPLLKV